MNTTEPTSEDVQALMARVRELSDLIVKQQASADRGEFTSIGAAIGLQKLRRDRQELQGRLGYLRALS